MPPTQEKSVAAPSRPELLPYEPQHILDARARATKKVEVPEFSDLLVESFASGSSSGAKVPIKKT